MWVLATLVCLFGASCFSGSRLLGLLELVVGVGCWLELGVDVGLVVGLNWVLACRLADFT